MVTRRTDGRAGVGGDTEASAGSSPSSSSAGVRVGEVGGRQYGLPAEACETPTAGRTRVGRHPERVVTRPRLPPWIHDDLRETQLPSQS